MPVRLVSASAMRCMPTASCRRPQRSCAAPSSCSRILPGAHSNLGLVPEQTGEREGAIHAYDRAILIEPDPAEARANLGTALLHADRLDDAILHLRRAAALRPRVANNHFFLGVALQRRDAAAEAAECFRTAIALKPDFVEAY